MSDTDNRDQNGPRTLAWSDWNGNSESFMCSEANLDRHRVRICRWRFSHSTGYELSFCQIGDEFFHRVCGASSTPEALDAEVQEAKDRALPCVMQFLL